ncbi:alpha/beta fold hydrolase [Bacteroidota bacterium]
MDLFYRELGKGQPIIILHGLYGNSDNWLSIGKSLAEKYKVYMIDQRNHGNSIHCKEHNFELFKKDLAGFIQKKKIENPVLIGHSMGGKTAMYYTRDNMEKVKALIVVDISPRDYTHSMFFEDRYNMHLNIILSLESINLHTLLNRKEANSLLAKRIKSDSFRRFLLKNLKRDENKDFTWKLNLKSIKNNLREIFKGFNDEDGELRIETPALFLKGELSDYIGEEDIAFIQRVFINSEIIEVENTGHLIHAEKTDEFLRYVEDFLDRVEWKFYV